MDQMNIDINAFMKLSDSVTRNLKGLDFQITFFRSNDILQCQFIGKTETNMPYIPHIQNRIENIIHDAKKILWNILSKCFADSVKALEWFNDHICMYLNTLFEFGSDAFFQVLSDASNFLSFRNIVNDIFCDENGLWHRNNGDIFSGTYWSCSDGAYDDGYTVLLRQLIKSEYSLPDKPFEKQLITKDIKFC